MNILKAFRFGKQDDTAKPGQNPSGAWLPPARPGPAVLADETSPPSACRQLPARRAPVPGSASLTGAWAPPPVPQGPPEAVAVAGKIASLPITEALAVPGTWVPPPPPPAPAVPAPDEVEKSAGRRQKRKVLRKEEERPRL